MPATDRTALQRLEGLANALASPPWWVWPAVMVAIAVCGLAASFAFAPLQGEQLALLGWPYPGTCDFETRFNLPCASCGMTRSWVWASRGAFLTAFAYNPAGFLLWLWMVVAGGLGLVRLITRNPHRWVLDFRLMGIWLMVWFGVFIGGWVLRITLGLNPLP